MSFDGRAVANFILDFCDAKGRRVTNLSLQKIVYFCHVWSLIELKRPLVRHQFEAWDLGPVLQYLYRDFRVYDSKPIVGRAMRIDPDNGIKQVVASDFDADTVDLLYRVVDFYSQLSASELVKLSHVKGGPWYEVQNHESTVNPGMKIDNDQIERFYSSVNPPFLVQ